MPAENEPQIDPEKDFETNLTQLLRRAYRPVSPSAAFERRMHAALHERRGRHLGRRTPLRVLAAAALLLIGALLWVVHSTGAIDAVADGGGTAFFRGGAAADAPWLRVSGRVAIARGDWIAATDGSVCVFEGERAAPSIELAPHALLHWDEPIQLVGGIATMHGVDGASQILETPFARIEYTGAVFRVEVVRSDGAPPISGESGPQMKKSILGGGLVAGAILVTVIILNTTDQGSVTVTTDKGARDLQAGDAARVSPAGDLEIAATVADGERPDNGASQDDAGTVAGGDVPDPGALRGVVLDHEGEPLANARVQFHVAADSTAAVIAPAVTNEEGVFALTIPVELKQGLLEVKCERFITGRQEWRRAEESPAESAATPVETVPPVEGGAAGGNELVVQLQHETAIAGIVADAAGEAYEKYFVGLQRIEQAHDWYEPRIENFPKEGSELGPGSFYIGGLDPGNYHVWIYAHGSYRSDPEILQLGEGEVRDDLHFTLKPGLSISGSVYSKRDGRPVKDAIVYAPIRHLPGSVNTILRTEVDPRVRDAVRTDEKGHYEAHDLAPGKYALRVLHPDFKPLDHEIKFTESEAPEPLDFALEEGTGIRGQVIDEQGEPMAGATVMAFTMTMVERELTEGRMTTVAEDGHYYLRHMNPGPYIVLRMRDIEAADEMPKVTMTTLNPRDDAVVDFIEVAELATLRGRVLDEKGEPLPGIGVTASTGSRTEFSFKNGMTDADGRFEIRNLQLSPHNIGLSKQYSMNMAVIDMIRFDEAIDYEREFVFHDLSLSGVITSAHDGIPVKNAELFILKLVESNSGEDADDLDRSDFAGLFYTNDSGHYRIEGLAEGKYRLLPNAAGYQRIPSDPIEIRAEAGLRDAVLDMKLISGFTVEIAVVGRQDAPIAGALVFIRDADKREINQGLPPRTDANGIYTFSNLAKGAYTAEVQAADAEPKTVSFQVPAGAPTRVRVEIEAP